MKRLLVGVGAAVAALGVLAPAAGAAKKPVGGCQAAYELTTVRDVLKIATPGFEDAIRAEDANQDNYLCVLLLPEPIPLFEPTFLYYDNDLPR